MTVDVQGGADCRMAGGGWGPGGPNWHFTTVMLQFIYTHTNIYYFPPILHIYIIIKWRKVNTNIIKMETEKGKWLNVKLDLHMKV